MPPKTIKKAIRNCLLNLSEEKFKEFRVVLRDRRDEPRIGRREVDGKDYLDVTDVMVSTFGEAKALEVVRELLEEINCNREADDLESKTKVSVDNGDPSLPKTSSGELETEPSQEARKLVADQCPSKATRQGGPPVKKPEEVEADAKARVRSEGGDPCNARLVLSRFIIQFGQYKGQTFKWLLENHVGYAVYVVATHQEERKDSKDQNPQMVHKDSLTRYATAYPEVLEEVKKYHIRKGLKRKRVQGTRGQPSTASSSRPTRRKQKRTRKK